MNIGTVKPTDIEEQVRVSYLEYAMSVIVSRALPDARDGLKPVHRRILYAMNDLGLRHNTSYKKCARIVGEVLGKYHPHGDSPVYEALVRMAQDFSMRYMLVDGQGNFGSVDNDPPAAMRYTEARMAEIAQEMLVDIDKDTVDFVPNFDNSLKEPTVLPARLPNLLVNGSSGIAVGMATNIPPHNLSEVCDAIVHLIDYPEAAIEDLLQFVKGPDFPTGGLILGREGIRKAYATGRGKVPVQAKCEIEENAKGRMRIVITELPYQTNKAELVEKIAILAKEKKVDGISELRDESDRQGMSIVIELKKDAHPKQVLNNLYKHTVLRSAFHVNMLALVNVQPKVINLKEALTCYIDFRHEVLTRRSQFELTQARERAHILEGLKIALDNLDDVIATIRASANSEAARNSLISKFGLSQIQAQAILDMQLRRLAALEQQKIIDEYEQIIKTIAYLEDLLANPRKIFLLVREEVEALKSKYGSDRRTQIVDQEAEAFQDEDLISHQAMVITLSTRGYVKRTPIDSFRAQHRGGRGVAGMATKEAEAARIIVSADTHDSLLFFSDKGKAYSLKCHAIPQDTSRVGRGVPIVNLISMDAKEEITTALKVSSFDPDRFLVMATLRGEVKKTRLDVLAKARSNGLMMMDLDEGDELVAVTVGKDEEQAIIVSKQGKAIKFVVRNLRAASRTSGGVRGLRLTVDDEIVGLDVAEPGSYLLVITEGGFGKCTRVENFPLQSRGGTGVFAFRANAKTGHVVASKQSYLSQELMVMSYQGVIIRMPIETISVQGRSTHGVSLMRPDPDDKVISIVCLDSKEIEAQQEASTVQPRLPKIG